MSSLKVPQQSSLGEEAVSLLSSLTIDGEDAGRCNEDINNTNVSCTKTSISAVTRHYKKKDNNPNLDKLGVSVHYLETQFMEEVRQAGLNETSKIYEIENLDNQTPGVIRRKGLTIMSPTDNKIGAAYVHCLEGDDNVGCANFMLSYTWDYSIGDIIDTLTSYCTSVNLDPKRTYIWICCLCVNQHRVIEQKNSGMLVPTDVFFNEFETRVIGIGHVLAMMAPWKKPKYLTRIWCIFEIYTAHQQQCQVTIVMPPEQKKQLQYELLSEEEGNFETLYEALANTKIEDANATVENDRVAILGMVKKNGGPGFYGLNIQVNALLRSWVLSSIRETARNQLETESLSEQERMLSHSYFCNRAGILLMENDELDEALVMYHKSLAIRESLLGISHHDTATTCNNIGAVLDMKGNYDEALFMYRKALAIRESTLGLNNADTAISYNNIGYILRVKGNYEEALVMHRKALIIFESVLGVDDTTTAKSYSNVGAVLSLQGNLDEALVMYNKALTIRESVYGVHHQDTARCYDNIGSVFYIKGEYDEALAMYRKALVGSEKILGTHHTETATSYNNIGVVLCDKMNYDEALDMHHKALAIRESVLGVRHEDTARSCHNIGEVLSRKGNIDEALVMHRRALEIRESVLGENHRDTATSYSNVGAVLRRKGSPNYDEALVMHRKAFSIFESTLGKNHQNTAAACINIACVLYGKGNYEEALNMHRKALAIVELELGSTHPHTLVVKGSIEHIEQVDLCISKR